MKLIDVWNAVYSSPGTTSPWSVLTALKKPPKVAYRLLKYGAKLGAEFDLINTQRNTLLCEAAGVPEGSPVNLKVGTHEFDKFAQDFNAFLNGDSDLEPVDMNMDTLIDSLGADSNAISENDLAVVEPFFKEKAKSAAA